MNLLRKIHQEHKSYYNKYKYTGSQVSVKQMLIAFFVAVPYIAFIFWGFHVKSRTIVSHEYLFLVTSLLAVVFYALLYFLSIRSRKMLRIIWNIVIIYIHSILFFGTLILIANYHIRDDSSVKTELEVIKWEEKSFRGAEKTSASVEFEGHDCRLDFEGHILDKVKNVEYIECELVNGSLGFVIVNSYKIGVDNE